MGDLFEQFGVIRADPVLRWAFVGNMYLWFLAALLQFTIVVYGHDVLRIDERHISYLQAAVAIGIGTGALVTGYLSSGKIEYGLIPLGAVGMTVFGFLSAGQGLSLERVAVYLGLLGFFGGFYAVPLQALIQHRPDPARKGGVIAAANLLSFVGVFLAAGVYFLLAETLHLRADKVFFAGACMTLAATFYAVVLLPDSLLRFALWTLTHTLYRIRVQGRDNIPERGGALFVSDRFTPALDAVLLSASTDRRIRFLVGGSSRTSGPSFIERVLRITAFPIQNSPRDVDSGRADAGAASNGGADKTSAGKRGAGKTSARERSAYNSTGHLSDGSGNVSAQRLEQLRAMLAAAFDADEVVCLAGDQSMALLTSDSPGRKPLDDLMLGANAPIVLVSLADTEGGALCGEEGRLFLGKKPAQVPCRVTVRFGSTLPPALRPADLRRAIAAFTSQNVSHDPAQSVPAARR